MFYDTKKNNHGLKYNPFKSCIVPRPIAWITTIDENGNNNCAPYSFFNGVSSEPPMIMYANNGKSANLKKPKDTLNNIKQNKEFVVNIVSYEAINYMNETCAPLKAGKSEIEYANLKYLNSKFVKPVRLTISPIHMECKLYKIIDLPIKKTDTYNGLVIGYVLGIHIDDKVIKDGKVNLKKIKPVSRLGYMDYSFIDNIFSLKRPE